MEAIGRSREIGAVDDLLNRADGGSGGVLVVSGPPGSGRTTLADVAADRARSRGFTVLRSAAAGQSVAAQFLRDVAAPEDLIARMSSAPGPQDLDLAAQLLCTGPARLLVVDDIERDWPATRQLLLALSGRSVSGRTAVLVTAVAQLGVGVDLRLGPLGEHDLGRVVGEDRPEVRHALWAASAGRPGRAIALARTLAELPADVDPVVELALRVESDERFLAVDAEVVQLLELALGRAEEDRVRARLLARLAYALLGDAFAAPRRRAIIGEALTVARALGDPGVLAEVLDAALHALWDARGADDRLTTADEIVDLARSTADLARLRRGLFWRFVALMELGRVAEAESALAAFERQARLAGDAAGEVMAVARHAMLATVRGRFDDAERLIEQVAETGKRIQLPDTEALLGSMRGSLAVLRMDRPTRVVAQLPPDAGPLLNLGHEQVETLRAFARAHPGHFYEANTARILAGIGRTNEATLELERVLPVVLAGSGPRWLGSVADLALVAVATGNAAAAEQLEHVLAPYRGRLVVWGGANSSAGPVAYFLGLLAAELGRADDAIELFSEAAADDEKSGALPWLAFTLDALADQLAGRPDSDDADRKAAAEHRRRARTIAQQLGLSGLLQSLAPPAEEWTLRHDGDDWVLTAGAEVARLRDSRGLGYLRALLAVPGREISSLDLAAGGAGLRDSQPAPTLDAAALTAYRRQLDALEGELDRADAAGDPARAQRLEDERAAVLDELRRGTGMGGRPRRLAAEDERARVSVTRTLRTAVDKITDVAPAAGAHLAASIRTGRACRYEPAPGGPSRWNL